MDPSQRRADASEDRAIGRLQFLRGLRGDPWVRRLVALALVAYLMFIVVGAIGPVKHRAPECLVVPTVAGPKC
jgi:hypothetical protein